MSASSSSSGSRSLSQDSTSNPARQPQSMAALNPQLAKIREIRQNRQARGKDPNTGEKPKELDEDIDMDEDSNMDDEYSDMDETNEREYKRAITVESEWDSYEASERRRWAAAVLDTPELISMWAEARNDSIPATKYHFMKIMAGYEN